MTKKKTLGLIVAGLPVSVRFDDDGRVLSASAGIERPGDLDHERAVALAAAMAFDAAVLAEKRVQRKDDSAQAAAASAQARAQASKEHWANKWLAQAHAAHPDYGKGRLAQHARRLAATDKDHPVEDPAKRDEISEQRARQFLAALRTAKKSGGLSGRSRPTFAAALIVAQ
jgi:hypothetical protein